MNKKISLFILIILVLSLFGSSPAPVHAQDWWNNSWSYRITIEINGTKIEDDFTNFPVLVYLNSSRIDWAHVQDDLDDLRFIDEDGITQLYAELENYTVNDEAWIWIKIPTVSVGGTNQLFYLYYGNNAVSSWWNPEDVWEDSAIMIQHMTDNPDTSHIMDSTQYDNDGIKLNPNEPIETESGKIDGAQSFDGVDDNVQISDAPSLGLTNTLTILAWIKWDDTQPDGRGWVTAKGIDYFIGLRKSTRTLVTQYLDFGGTWRGVNSVGTISQLWTHIATTIAPIGGNSTVKFYINGIEESFTVTGQPNHSTNPLVVGAFSSATERFRGVIDEVRIYDRALSAAEVKANYNSGADTLLIYGIEEIIPLALTVRYNIGINKLYINGTQRANNTTIYIDKNTNVNVTAISQSNYIFYRHILGLSSVSLIPMYLFNMTQPFTLWSYATPNFYIYEEPTTFTFTHWLILLFIALVISLLAAIKFHIIAVVSFILTVFMIINVASYSGMILLAIIAWILTILFSIVAILEI